MNENEVLKPEGKLPYHVAIIMDGNGRWAKLRELPRIAGHKAGEESITDVIRASSEWGLGALTLFAFSTENWGRPANEVKFLMSFNRNLLEKRIQEFHERNIRILHLGRREPIPRSTLEVIDKAVKLTRDNTGLTLCVALNYGGRAELLDAIRRICADFSKEEIMAYDIIDEEIFRTYLYAPDVPDPDLLIRTAGDMRISNFLIWQLAYTEIYITKVLWPDFRRKHLSEAIVEFQSRERRFGGVIEKE